MKDNKVALTIGLVLLVCCLFWVRLWSRGVFSSSDYERHEALRDARETVDECYKTQQTLAMEKGYGYDDGRVYAALNCSSEFKAYERAKAKP